MENGLKNYKGEIVMDNYEFYRQQDEKSTPQKPKVEHRQYFCPKCGTKLVAYNWNGGIHYCHQCGQAIDWENEVKEE